MKLLETISKYSLVNFISSIGIFGIDLLGGWDIPIQTLLFFMGIDYVTGILCAVSNKSQKTQRGGLKSSVGWTGLVKKGVTLLIVACAYRIDLLASIDYARNWTILSFGFIEFVSISENAGLLGVKVPKFLTKIIEVLKSKSDDDNQIEGDDND